MSNKTPGLLPDPENSDVPDPENSDVPDPENSDVPDPENSDVPDPENSDAPDPENSDVPDPENSDAMPFLFMNMGGEMAYILEQRLQAQNVGDQRSSRVLCEIVAVMLSKSFLDELFEPREMYTKSGLRQHFEQIAHSSVMRLNDASLIKLFDLMIMAVKYQFLLCKEPSELQMAVIRSELLNFLSGTCVKASPLLRAQRQLDDGRFVLFPAGEQIELPYNAVVPGSVRYVENGALVRAEQFLVDERFKVSPDFYQDRTMIRGTTLGQNMYKIGGEGAVPVREALSVQQQNTKTCSENKNAQPVVCGPGDELELLSLLIKGDQDKMLGADGFELELFEQDNNNDDDDTKEEQEEQARGGAQTTAHKAKKTAEPKESSLSKAVKEMDLDKGEQQTATAKPPSRKGSRKGKQLLELMDQEGAATAGDKTPAAKKTNELIKRRTSSVKRGDKQ
ncbi:Protein oscp1 [Globodera pallida]|nr:Protein oscp1 [Globodera pallida]